ncbi:GntR family transcriptional regulator [Maricaulis parjimensis]|uniref:GntR family transcriptional regulator n=1 Tax=Maricaulis parjimensis TaxID=144023 RepID=UPI00193A5B56|nr:GntR family transcriptional regulator [Maricaulis parjimensis]
MSPAPRSKQQIQALYKLREMILAGEFAPGERVSELAVVERLGISRTPVRLALTILQHEGFLQGLPGGGYRVREFSLQDVLDAIEIRGVLEGAAARLAAERRPSAEELAELQATCAAMDSIVIKPMSEEVLEQYSELNGRFHSQLLALSKSPMLSRSLAHVEALPFASPNAFVFVGFAQSEQSDILKFGQHQHADIVEAIAQGEGGRAEALAREHARLARRNLATAQKRMDLYEKVPGSFLFEAGAAPDETGADG